MIANRQSYWQQSGGAIANRIGRDYLFSFWCRIPIIAIYTFIGTVKFVNVGLFAVSIVYSLGNDTMVIVFTTHEI